MSTLPTRQQQLIAVLCEYEEPQPAAVLARVMRYKHGASRSVVYDLLGPLNRKGLVRLTVADGKGLVRLTPAGRHSHSKAEDTT